MYVITNVSGQRLFGSPIVARQVAENTAWSLRFDGETVQVRRDGIVVTLLNDAGIQQLVS